MSGVRLRGGRGDTSVARRPPMALYRTAPCVALEGGVDIGVEDLASCKTLKSGGKLPI
jgi:hypothetical protein